MLSLIVFLPRDNGLDLSDIYFFQDIYYFVGIGDGLQYCYYYALIFVAWEFIVFEGDWDIFNVEVILSDYGYCIWSEDSRWEVFYY